MFTLQDLERAVETADYVVVAAHEGDGKWSERRFSKDENICGFNQRR